MNVVRPTGGISGQALKSDAIRPSEGIYYVVRFPERWELFTLRFDTGHESGHPDFWQQHVVPRLSRRWTNVLGHSVGQLELELRRYEYGFPRGRVVKQGKRFLVYHGRDLEPFMKIKRTAIEALFGIVGLARWKEDEHERCLREDKEPIRQILQLWEDWRNVIPD